MDEGMKLRNREKEFVEDNKNVIIAESDPVLTNFWIGRKLGTLIKDY